MEKMRKEEIMHKLKSEDFLKLEYMIMRRPGEGRLYASESRKMQKIFESFIEYCTNRPEW